MSPSTTGAGACHPHAGGLLHCVAGGIRGCCFCPGASLRPAPAMLRICGGGALPVVLQKHSEAGDGRPVDRGVWTAKTVKRPRQQPAHPQYANYWAPLTRKRHIPPHSAQPQHTNDWAPRSRKRHQQEHRPQRPTERSDATQHAKGRTGDCPGPRKGATTRRNVTQGALPVVLHRRHCGRAAFTGARGTVVCLCSRVLPLPLGLPPEG